MSLVHVRATFGCDGCGRNFIVELPNDMKANPEWTMFEEAVECLKEGDFLRYEGDKRSGTEGPTFSSVQGGLHLCPQCTSLVDDYVTEDRDATEDEVKAALEAKRFESTSAVQGQDDD